MFGGCVGLKVIGKLPYAFPLRVEALIGAGESGHITSSVKIRVERIAKSRREQTATELELTGEPIVIVGSSRDGVPQLGTFAKGKGRTGNTSV